MSPTPTSSSLPQTPELDHYPTPSPSRPTLTRTPFFNIRRTPESQPEPRPRLEPANDIYDPFWPNRSPTPKPKPKHPSTEFILLSQQISPTWSKELLENIPICFNAWFNPYTYHRWLFNHQVSKDDAEKEMLDNSHEAALEFICDSLPDGFMDEFVEYTELEVTGRKVDLYVLVERIGSIVRELQSKYDTHPPPHPSIPVYSATSTSSTPPAIPPANPVDKPAHGHYDSREHIQKPMSRDAEVYASYVPPTRTCPVKDLKPYHSAKADRAFVLAETAMMRGSAYGYTGSGMSLEGRRQEMNRELYGPLAGCVLQ